MKAIRMVETGSKYIIYALTILSFMVCAHPAAAAAGIAVTAIIDDFNDADPYYNFLGLETSAGRVDDDGEDLEVSYDVFDSDSALHTAHQVSWDANCKIHSHG